MRVSLDKYCEKKVEILSSQYEGFIDYIDISSVDNLDKKIVNIQELKSTEAPSRAKQILQVGDILVSTVRPNLNAIAMVEQDSKNILVGSTGYCVLRCKNTINKRFVFYFCQSTCFVGDMVKQATGASYPAVNSSIVKKSLIPNYPKEKQDEIVNNLDKVCSLISLRKQQLSKLDELVKARFVELFGDIVNCPKYSGIPLGSICSTLSGGTPSTKVSEYYQGDIPWISTPYLGNNHIDGSSAKAYITEDAIKNSATHLIPANTIMFGIRVGVGKSSIIDEPMCANQDIVALMNIDTKMYDLLFIKHVLDAYQNHFDSIKKGATILGITTDDLKKVVIPSVDMKLQRQFADFVKQIDKSKFEVQQSLEKLESLKKSLMQQYFG